MWHIALYVICGICGTFSCYSEVYQAMTDNMVQPDVVLAAPRYSIHVNYTNGVNVELGNNLTFAQIKDKPKIKYGANQSQLYTLCLTEPLDPSPIELYPYGKENLHWLVVNIPGHYVEKGNTLFNYNSSTVINLSRPNRYVFLLYKQPKILNPNKFYWEKKYHNDWSNFTIFIFAYDNKMKDPVAGNIFLTGYKDPSFLKKIKPDLE